MVSEAFKKAVDDATMFLESCFDENNPNDPRSFDERVQDQLHTLSPQAQDFVRKSLDWEAEEWE